MEKDKFTSQKYIDEVSALYVLDDKALAKLERGRMELDRLFGDYWWHDVKDAIAHYYTRKNDKSRPLMNQVAAILSTWEREGRIDRREPVIDTPAPLYTLPKTKIWSIADTFSRVINTMVQCKILAPEYPSQAPQGAGWSLIGDNGLPVLNVKQTLRWLVSDAKAQRPDLFAKYPHATFWEEVAIAVQGGMINLKIRKWGDYTLKLKTRNPNWRQDIKNDAIFDPWRAKDSQVA